MNNFFEIKNATFKAGGKDKIKNLSIEIKNEGDIVCLLGPFQTRSNSTQPNPSPNRGCREARPYVGFVRPASFHESDEVRGRGGVASGICGCSF